MCRLQSSARTIHHASRTATSPTGGQLPMQNCQQVVVLRVTTKHAHASLAKKKKRHSRVGPQIQGPHENNFDANTKPFGASTVSPSHHRPSTKIARLLEHCSPPPSPHSFHNPRQPCRSTNAKRFTSKFTCPRTQPLAQLAKHGSPTTCRNTIDCEKNVTS